MIKYGIHCYQSPTHIQKREKYFMKILWIVDVTEDHLNAQTHDIKNKQNEKATCRNDREAETETHTLCARNKKEENSILGGTLLIFSLSLSPIKIYHGIFQSRLPHPVGLGDFERE